MVECEYDRDPESHSGGCSFNRYMVECEYILKLESKRIITVLIDTWWNVNYIQTICEDVTSFGFNRYMVECE